MPFEVPVFYWLLVSAFCCLVAIFSILHIYRQAQRGARQHLRDRIAADLHDDIGANLSQLTVLSEVLSRQTDSTDPQLAHSLSILAGISRETVSALGDIVWATNPHEDGMTNLLCRMRRFANEILPPAGIEFSFHAPLLKSELQLDAELRRQLYLIFKESLNNLVRHSGCDQTSIELRIESAYLTLRISDNGKGFDAAQPQEGNGLRSLSRRANALDAYLSLTSSLNGTTIFLRARYRQTAGQVIRHWWTAFKWQDQPQWHPFRAILHTYLNRGVTQLGQRSTLPLQPIMQPIIQSPPSDTKYIH